MRESNAFLPTDGKGRLACLVTGIFFGGFGFYSLVILIANQRDVFGAFVAYEASIVAMLFGGSLIIWSVFKPAWMQHVSQRIAAHLVLFVAALFIPFALRVIVLLISGDV
jgi:hypothetical protein